MNSGSAIREVATGVGRSENPARVASTAGCSDGALGAAVVLGVNVGVDAGLGAANVGVEAGVGVAKIAGDDAGSVAAGVAAGA